MKKKEYIKILQDVIQIESENGNEEQVAIYYRDLLKRHGIPSQLVTYFEGRSSLISEISNGPGPVLALSGHMDVVSVGNVDDWTYPPFSGHIEKDVIWGRGASDMKAGLTALILAFIEIYESQQFKGKVKLLATVGEEVGELGSAQLTDLGYLDDVEAVLIGEPCNIGVVCGHKGSLNYKVTSKGTSAHSSTPELGNNAIEHILLAMTKISERITQKSDQIVNEVLGKTFHNITLVTGGSQVNSIPEYAKFEANARTIPEFDNQALMQEVFAVIRELNKKEGFDLEATITADQPPVQTNPNSKLIETITNVANAIETLKPQSLVHQMNTVLGEDEQLNPEDFADLNQVKPMVVSGTTDAAQFIRANDNLELAVYGPGMPTLNHKLDERLPLAQYLDFIDVYKVIIESYLIRD
ncbi:ArgE/DapE family deacylase [Streptococcus porcinus]|uniref:ArgE/DapE family deacylase n=1 Tax=Streptococcus porcinus TaxID=1340 RepID=UPI000B8AE6D6|nr:ArgE/DapE family deacylase [Streptococcus porcinus]VTT42208.1 Catalyzes the cleavage of p-aminobenzoyl-glutamate to p-aminobenzoate and glutamate, subunit A [Streptococcus porcinus]